MMFFQKKIYLTVIFIAVIIAGFVFGAILSLAKEIKSVSNEYTDNKTLLLKMDKEVNLLRINEKLLEDVKLDLSSLDNAFLEQDQEKIAEFLSVLEGEAQKIGISIEVKSAVSSDKIKPYFNFKIFLKGDFSNIVRFLAAMENSLEGFYRLIEIENLNMQRVVKDNGITIECALDLKVHSE